MRNDDLACDLMPVIEPVARMDVRRGKNGFQTESVPLEPTVCAGRADREGDVKYIVALLAGYTGDVEH